MPLAPRDPRTIYLGGGFAQGGGGGITLEERFTTSVAATPGMLAESHNVSDVLKWRPHATAAGAFAQAAFYLERIEHMQDIDTPYVADELARIGILHKGSTVYPIVPSGQDVQVDDPLESNGDGRLKVGTTAPVCRALESVGAVTADTRVRAVVI